MLEPETSFFERTVYTSSCIFWNGDRRRLDTSATVPHSWDVDGAGAVRDSAGV